MLGRNARRGIYADIRHAGEAVHVVDVLEGGGDELGVEAGAIAAGFGGGFFDEGFPGDGSEAGVKQDTFGLEDHVAAGTAGLLLISLDGFGHGDVQDEADVGAVDAHAEGDGGDDEVAFFLDKLFLHAPAEFGGHAGVIAGDLAAQLFVVGEVGRRCHPERRGGMAMYR